MNGVNWELDFGGMTVEEIEAQIPLWTAQAEIEELKEERNQLWQRLSEEEGWEEEWRSTANDLQICQNELEKTQLENAGLRELVELLKEDRSRRS